MTRQDRAKQFMPFDAMKGLKEALLAREEMHFRSERRELSEDEKAKLSVKLERLEKGMKVELCCHKNFHDIKLSGYVDAISAIYKYLLIDSERIYFDDIYDIKILEYGK